MVYQLIDKILAKCDADYSAAEAHGLAAGMLCVNTKAHDQLWLDELFREAGGAPDAQQQTLLIRLFGETARLMNGDEFEFDVLLPPDEDGLSQRIVALKSWCNGFLFGIGRCTEGQVYSENAREILRDITEFTRLETDAEGEEDEFAFMELTEYLRSAVLLLHEEFISGHQLPSSTVH